MNRKIRNIVTYLMILSSAFFFFILFGLSEVLVLSDISISLVPLFTFSSSDLFSTLKVILSWISFSNILNSSFDLHFFFRFDFGTFFVIFLRSFLLTSLDDSFSKKLKHHYVPPTVKKQGRIFSRSQNFVYQYYVWIGKYVNSYVYVKNKL